MLGHLHLINSLDGGFIIKKYYKPPNMTKTFTLTISSVIFQFHLLSSWGDQYYVGLNGLEFYDAQGNKIDLKPNSKEMFNFLTSGYSLPFKTKNTKPYYKKVKNCPYPYPRAIYLKSNFRHYEF